jgi:hypothetical protein
MGFPAVIVVSILCLLGGCSKSPGVAADTIGVAHSVCDLPVLHADHAGQRVKIRGLFSVHAHGFFLRDENCPRYMLILKRTADGPDTSLCSPDRLVQEFGCPGGNDNGPIVTVSGILKPSKMPKVGVITVDEMADFENVRTGKRFNLAPNASLERDR